MIPDDCPEVTVTYDTASNDLDEENSVFEFSVSRTSREQDRTSSRSSSTGTAGSTVELPAPFRSTTRMTPSSRAVHAVFAFKTRRTRTT